MPKWSLNSPGNNTLKKIIFRQRAGTLQTNGAAPPRGKGRASRGLGFCPSSVHASHTHREELRSGREAGVGVSEMGSNVAWVGHELAQAKDKLEEGGWPLERLQCWGLNEN